VDDRVERLEERIEHLEALVRELTGLVYLRLDDAPRDAPPPLSPREVA
jgi:hypothetical protein